ncbi:MAG: multidrug efflux pump subunit AcrB, partial [Limisphaerales bacterium]
MTTYNTLIDVFARHRVAANLAMVMMVLSGLWAADRIPTQLDPAIEWPVVRVHADWPGASAEDVEKLIVIPIEQQLRTLDGLQELRSTSYIGGAFIRIQFNHGVDMIGANDTVKQRIAQIRNFPSEMETLRIQRDVDYEYISAVSVTGPGPVSGLVPLVQAFEKELLARGIDQVDFEGLPEEELAVQVSSARLYELNTSLDQVAREIRTQSVNAPAGTLGHGQGARQLRSLDQKREVSEFAGMQVALQPEGRLTRLGDIATVEKRPREGETLLMRDGKSTITMHLRRLTDHDAIDSANVLHAWLADTRETLPPGVEIHVYQEVWMLLKQQLDMIFENGLTGLLLVIGTLFIFLSGRVGLWVMVGIPVSFLFATLLYFAIFSGGINILALITFVMALGIVVDDAIVVGEDAATLFEQGYSPAEAAAGGAKRMFLPVMTSSLTTMAAFVPLLLTGGEMGAFIQTMPTVLLCVIVASLIECFLVLPGHLKHAFEQGQKKPPGRFRPWFDQHFIAFRDQRYKPMLNAALANPGVTLCCAIACVILAFSLAISGRVGVNFVTGIDLESIDANVEFGASASDDNRQDFVAHLERTLLETGDELGTENLNGYVVKLNRAHLNQEQKYGSEFASVEVEFAWEEERSVTPQVFVDAWREKVVSLPFVEQLQLGVRGGANNGMPDISLVLRGQDIPSLKQAAEELKTA